MTAAPKLSLGDVVSGFATCSPELLAGRALQVRHDHKFAVPRAALPGILTVWQHSHASLGTVDHRFARYETQYYDTPELRSFRDHARRRPRRTKVRRRTYVDRALTTFEVKVKSPRGLTTKHRLEVHGVGPGLSAEEAALVRAHTDLSPIRLRPSLSNNYRRMTLVGRNTPERVTVDIDLSFRFGGRTLALPELAIVEVKTPLQASASPSLRKMSSLHHRAAGLSKYCLGLHLLHPQTPRGWFAKLAQRLVTTGALDRSRFNALP